MAGEWALSRWKERGGMSSHSWALTFRPSTWSYVMGGGGGGKTGRWLSSLGLLHEEMLNKRARTKGRGGKSEEKKKKKKNDRRTLKKVQN